MSSYLPILLLVGTIMFGILFGERTSKPLWLSGVIPAALATAIIMYPVLFNTPVHRRGDALEIVGSFIPAAWILYGGLGYFSAKRNRKK